MPFGAIPVIGAGAGAAAGMEGIQQNQLRQQDLLAQLMMHAQQMQAQREQTAALRQSLADARQTSAQAAKERADTGRLNLQRESLNAIPGGAQVPDELAQSPIAQGQTESRLPSRQYAGWSQIGSSQQPTVGGQTGAASTGEMQAQTKPGGFFKLPSAKETSDDENRQLRIKLEELGKKDEPLAEVNQGGKPIFMPRSQAIGKEAFQRPQTQQIIPVQTMGGPDGQTPVTKLVPKVAGAEYENKPPTQVLAKKEDRKRAMDGLDQLDKAIENAKQFIGPGMGRVSTLEQMVGNPDPRVQALGTKMLMAKMTVDAGIGGARAAASPQLLQRWDNLFSQKLTPEALHSTVQAMREMMGGAQDAGTSGSALPTVGGTYQGGKVLKVEKVQAP